MGYSPRVAKSRTRLSNFTFTFSLADGTALLSSRCPEMGFPQRPPGLVKAQKSCLALQVSPLDKNSRVGGHALFQGMFLTQGLNPHLPHCRQILYHLSHQRNPTGAQMQIANSAQGSGAT